MWRGELSEGPAQAKSGAARPGGHLEQLAVVPTDAQRLALFFKISVLSAREVIVGWGEGNAAKPPNQFPQARGQPAGLSTQRSQRPRPGQSVWGGTRPHLPHRGPAAVPDQGTRCLGPADLGPNREYNEST